MSYSFIYSEDSCIYMFMESDFFFCISFFSAATSELKANYVSFQRESRIMLESLDPIKDTWVNLSYLQLTNQLLRFHQVVA